MIEPLSGIAAGLPEWFWLAIAVAASILILALLYRLIVGARTRRHRAQHARIAIVDVEEVDGRRRLVLIRRDDVEHLVMIGGPGDVVIETGITTRLAASPRPTPTPSAQQPRPLEPAVEPQVPTMPTPTPLPEAAPPRAENAPPFMAPPVTQKPTQRTAPPVSPPPTAGSHSNSGGQTSTKAPPAAYETRTAELDEEINELLAQMGRDRGIGPARG